MPFRELTLLALLAGSIAAQQLLIPVSACEILRDPAAWQNKPVSIASRYSLRHGTHWLGCGEYPQLPILFDASHAPRLPESAILDQAAAEKALKEVRAATNLPKLRFGSPDYDRWAIVYGTVQRTPSGIALMIRGEGVVFFYPEN